MGTIVKNGVYYGSKATAEKIPATASTAKAYVLGIPSTSGASSFLPTYNTAIYTSGTVLYGAAWNDYAEVRMGNAIPGTCVCEVGDGTLIPSTERLQAGGAIVSDTFGMLIGDTENCDLPIAVSGRVLAYPYQDISQYRAGDAVCAAPGGTIDVMTRNEIINYPDRIIGIVSEIPSYKTWGADNINVLGRIWIKIK